jgi:hypothetical protein
MLSIPFLLFAISLASIVSVTPLHIGPFTLKQGVPIVVLVIGIFSWATVARIVRGQVIVIRHREYVEAARAVGAPTWRLILREILPNVAPTIIVYATLLIPVSIAAEAALSYLGVGVPPPTATGVDDRRGAGLLPGRLVVPRVPVHRARDHDACSTSSATASATPRPAGGRYRADAPFLARARPGLIVIWL